MGHDKIADTQVFKQPRSNWFCPSLRAQAKQSMASTAAAFSPRPACGERSRASCERVRGTLDRLALADSPPHPETLLRGVSDLSPQAGRGEAAASGPCGCCLLLSSPAKAGDPVRRSFSIPSPLSLEYWIVRRTLSSGAHSRDPVADDDGVDASGGFRFDFSNSQLRSRGVKTPELCQQRPSRKEGAGNAGCALHP